MNALTLAADRLFGETIDVDDRSWQTERGGVTYRIVLDGARLVLVRVPPGGGSMRVAVDLNDPNCALFEELNAWLDTWDDDLID